MKRASPAKLAVGALLLGLLPGGGAMAGLAKQGTDLQGLSFQGLSFQGLSFQGLSFQGLSFQGLSFQGLSFQGLSFQGLSFQGLSFQGLSFQGLSFQGLSFQGLSFQSLQLAGIDRARGLSVAARLRGVARADVQPSGGTDLQGLQTGAPLGYTEIPTPMAGVRLQAGPTDTSPGSFIHVPGVPDLKGTLWNMVFSESCESEAACASPATCDSNSHACVQACVSDSQCAAPGKCVLGSCSNTEGNVALYIADVEKDTSTNSSTSPGNDDVYLYTVYFRQPATRQWIALCPLDDEGKARAMAIPLDHRDWTSDGSRAKFAFACTASGVAAKCTRNWGYKPWRAAHAPYYSACLIAARADYCQNDQSFTRDGTVVDLFDSDSINATVGLPFAPGASGVMLAEEYQVSIARHVAEVIPDWQYMSLPPDEQALVTRLLRSGLEASRYADLDPGRSCPAAAYVERCSDPFACTRAGNMSGPSYGSYLAVNSARQCAHSDAESGEPLAPSCNACTNRVCQIDPSCCGNPGPTAYPRALAWDDRCIALRDQVCRSSPGQPPWRAGKSVASVRDGPLVFLRGAVGSFEVIVAEGGAMFAEGWACDPDFSGASSPVQISIGGALGAPGATLSTAIADQPLAAGWRDAVAVACGGPGRHGFRFPLPDDAAGKDLYVYGIDLNIPGAPVALLRGGRKTVPATASPAPSPRAAIWSGWIEPAASGNYTFCKQQPGAIGVCSPLSAPTNPSGEDHYRIWVNGRYVAGNWVDAPTAPDAFTLPPPTAATALYLQRGVRYAVRIEYRRPADLPPASEMVLLWSADGALPVEVPTSALHPIGQPSGNGLQATFFPGSFPVGSLPDNGQSPVPPQVGSVDRLWTDADPPFAGLSVEDSFAVRLEGQFVPPISGEYTFSAESDGLVRITVNGRDVSDPIPTPGDFDPETCAHDICMTGAPINRTCRQGSFCAGRLCIADASCCSVTWDARCVQEVKQVCGIDCASAPIAIPLRAGWKYDVKVEYHHAGGRADAPARAARLKVMTALAQMPRDVITIARLFAPAAASPMGTGINVAYFSDAVFTDESLAHVEPMIDFRGTRPPAQTRDVGLVCGTPSGPACGPAGGLDAPIVLAGAIKRSAGGGLVAVEIRGGGAVRNATVTVSDGGSPLFTVIAAADAADGGLFKREVNLTPGLHRLTAFQAAGGLTSGESAAFEVNVVDPGAPPPPQVSQPPSQTVVVSSDGRIAVAGTAAPGATVTATTTPAGAGGTPSSITFTVGAAGDWSGVLTLPPGRYDLAVTQTVNGATSVAGRPTPIEVTIPPLAVTSPADGAVLTCPDEGTGTCPVRVEGQGAAPDLGDVIVAAGDPDRGFFVDLDPRLSNRGGSFDGTLALDYGRHALKIFQRANGLDGAGERRTIVVRPPLGSLAITQVTSRGETTTLPAPPPGPIVDPSVIVVGSGGLPRTGLPGTVIVYQGTTPVAETLLDDSGRFEVPLWLTGEGIQTLSVSQTARSLSGAGSAESERAAITVRLRPAAPTIDAPPSGREQPNTLIVDVRGTAAPGATVTIYANDVAQAPSPLAAPAGAPDAGRFAVQLASLAAGTYRLTARATLDGATGPESQPPVLIALGDVAPPAVAVARNPVLVSAQDESGADVDIASLVRASDDGAPLPASAINCSPAGNPIPRFPVGSTPVTCEVYDAAGNRGATTFVVTVTSAELPSIVGTGLIAEAQGPAGAVVSYQVAATGFAADCAPAGSGESQTCDRWRPVNRGLGFVPDTLAMNTGAGADRGALYTMMTTGPDYAHKALFRRPPGGADWEHLGGFDAVYGSQIALGVGAPAPLYVPVEDEDGSPRAGIKVSRDGGRSWSTALQGTGIGGVAADPHDAARLHFFAWRSYWASGPTLYETHDGWVTWSQADQGLPPERVRALAIDPLNADRIYLSVAPGPGDVLNARIFRRIDGGPWEPLAIPPAIAGSNYEVRQFFIAPTTDGCGAPQRFPTIFAGHLISRDGGDTWAEFPPPLQSLGEEVWTLFDRSDPCVVHAGAGDSFYTSLDGGRSWPIGGPTLHLVSVAQNSPVQDLADPRTLYLSDPYRGVMTTSDGGATWSSLAPGGPSLRETIIYGLAADPVDPNIVLAVSYELGVVRSTDGGEHWQPATPVREQSPDFTSRGPILTDPLARNKACTGTASDGIWSCSLDGGANWAPARNAAGAPATGAFALDPLVAGHWISIDGVGDGRTLSIRDNANIGGTGELVVPVAPAPGSAPMPSWVSSRFVRMDPYRLQLVPDAGRTAVVSWRGDANLFSLSQAQPDTPLLAEGGGLGHDVHYDGSDGTHRLFIDGGKIGRTPNVLHRTTVAEARLGPLPNAPWEPLGGDPGLTGFDRLIIDPASGGQKMYTVGARGTLWESRDGGQSWQQDRSTPAGVTGLWLSRADGALYATLVRWPEGGERMLLSEGWGLLWKRTPDTGAPANGRVRKGDLRVNCLPVDPGPVDPASGLPLRATGPGSTFPLGDTALRCSATDVFGNTATAAITISVRDTLPPVITLDSPPEPAVAPPGGAAAVSFAVSAHDAVDGGRPVSCTHESGAAFPIGITTVTCTAADASNPPHTSQLAFPVIVSPQGGPPVGVPELVLPSAVEAVHASGAPLLVSASSWGGAPLVPSCIPAVGSVLPIGITAVTCTATDPETRLSVTRAADVTVGDTTPPDVTAPADLDVDAQGAFGARVTYGATASDVVDGAVEVSCAPDAGAVFPLGMTPVSCRAVDRAGNQGFAHFNVTVRDRSPAALHLTDMTVDASDSTGARVTFAPAPTATDIAGRPVAIECFPPSGSLFPLGDTAVTCTAAPGTPNEASGTFMIKVERDTTPPVLTLSGPASVTITDCATPDLGAATATDAEGSFVTVSSDRPKTFPLGTTIVTYTAHDASGNASTKAQTVTAVLGDDPSCCPAGTNVIIGTRAGEVIVGTPGRDCILGRGGGDRIDGGRGDDLISGGDGDDVIDGGGGDDHIFGGAGDDVLRGGVGMDHLEGGPGRDVLDYFAMRRRARGRLMP